MHSSRFTASVVALCLGVAALSLAQTTANNNPVDDRIRQADALQDKGKLQAARNIYESALKTLRLAGPSRQLGHVLNGLSNVASSEGNYEQAVEFARQAGDVYHRLGDIEGEAYALNSRGIAEGQLGEYPAAQESFQQALVFSRSKNDLETTVRTLNNLGNAYYFPGKYLEALHAYRDAWDIVERNPNEKWSGSWRQITRINQATLFQRLGRYQNALEIYRQVETSSGALSPSDQAHLLTNLGALYRRLGDPWKALDSYSSALKLYSRQHDADGEISVLKNIGIVYALDQSDLAKAHRIFEQTLSRATQSHNEREVMQGHLYLGETLLRQGVIKTAQDEFKLAFAQAKKLETREEQWKALYAMGQIEELVDDAKGAEANYREAISIIETTRSELQLSALRAEFLADKRDAYDALIRLLLNKNDAKEAFVFVERSRARNFQDRLASPKSSGTAPIPEAPDLDEIRKYLDPSSILLEYWVSGNRLALIWCTRESYGIQQAELSPAEKDKIRSFLRRLPESLGTDWHKETGVLTRLIPDSVALPSNLRHALIVPDGWLSSVPFDLVPLTSRSGNLLIEEFDISYLPTAALLRRGAEVTTSLHFPWMRELVAFGNPVVEAPANLDTSAGLQALPYSAEEIQGIAKMARGRSELFLGTADVKSAFLAKANNSPLLHASTHAFVDADIPENSRILFSPETSNGEPDYLFLRELYDLDLRGVNLATLSACNTERGKLIRGEGVQAFSRALLYSGSRSALTTLWRVADQPTSEFMKQFYYYALVRRQSKAEALRSAKLKFLRSKTELENPVHWAAFVLTGDGFNVLPSFVSWGTLIVSVIIAVIAIASGARFLLRVRRRIYRIDRS